MWWADYTVSVATSAKFYTYL